MTRVCESAPRLHRRADEKLGDRRDGGGAQLEKVREGGGEREEAKRSARALKMGDGDEEVDGEA